MSDLRKFNAPPEAKLYYGDKVYSGGDVVEISDRDAPFIADPRLEKAPATAKAAEPVKAKDLEAQAPGLQDDENVKGKRA